MILAKAECLLPLHRPEGRSNKYIAFDEMTLVLTLLMDCHWL
jgi:hypothetical protein